MKKLGFFATKRTNSYERIVTLTEIVNMSVTVHAHAPACILDYCNRIQQLTDSGLK